MYYVKEVGNNNLRRFKMVKELNIEVINKMILAMQETHNDLDNNIKSFFAPVTTNAFDSELIINRISRAWTMNRKGCPFEISICVKNKKYHWSSEMISSEIKISENGDVDADFRHGSGGWNEFPGKLLLDVFSSGIDMIKHSILIVEESSKELYPLIKSKVELGNEIAELHGKVAGIEMELEIEANQKTVNDLMKDHVKVNINNIMKELTSSKGDWEYKDLVRVEVYSDKFKIRRGRVEIEKYGNTRFKLEGLAISKKALIETDFSNYYYKKIDYNDDFYGVFKTNK